MEPLIRRTFEEQDVCDEHPILGFADLSNNEMDLEGSFPSQVIWTAEIQELKRFSFTIPVTANLEERQYHSAKQELYDSERMYLKFLLTVQRFFMDALEDMRTSNKNSGIKKTHLRDMFAEIPTIYNVNKELLRELRTSSVPNAFNKISPFLKSYSAYARNYPNIIKAYDELSANSEIFNELITRQQIKPPCQGNSLMALMIMPIQRLPRYIMLLSKMKVSSPCPNEQEQLEEVLSKIDEITELTESCIRDFENQQQLYRIQRDLGRQIVAPGRRIIREGPLYKISQSSDSHDERMFWLFNDILVYGKRRFITPKFTCSCIIPLKHCRLVYNELEGSLLIYCKDHCVMVTSDNYDNLKEWKAAIQTAIERMNILRSTLRKESSRQHVRNFKNRLVKKFTNKFTKKTYPVNEEEEEAETPIFRTDSERTPNTRQVKYRKRKADLAFETELKEVLEKRKLQTENVDEDPDKPTSSQAIPEYSRRTPNRTSTKLDNKGYNRLPEYNLSPIKAVVNYEKQESYFENDENVGVDECDRIPRRGGTARRVVAEKRQAVLRSTPPRVLSQPEIRLYSYQKPSAPINTESPVKEGDSSFEFDVERSKLAQERAIPWWVSEAAPALYTQKKRGGIVDTVRSNCSLM